MEFRLGQHAAATDVESVRSRPADDARSVVHIAGQTRAVGDAMPAQKQRRITRRGYSTTGVRITIVGIDSARAVTCVRSSTDSVRCLCCRYRRAELHEAGGRRQLVGEMVLGAAMQILHCGATFFSKRTTGGGNILPR